MKNQKRGKNVAIVGTVLQAVISLVMIVIWRLTGSTAALASLWLLLGGIPLWLITAVLFYSRQLEEQEALELQELQGRGDEGGNIFDETSQLALRPAASRVVFMERWIVPLFTLLFAGYHAVLAILMLLYVHRAEPTTMTNAAEGTVFLILIGFGAFLFSRYCTGMGSMTQLRFLRGTGSFLLICALFIAAVAIGLLIASQQNATVEAIVAYILPVIQIIFAIELILNFILDIYRPRVPGDQYHPSYESRLFGLLAEPGRVGHSIADTINYQFGFEVSKTWFYQLISRSFVPLVVFGVIVMFLLSSVVIVQDGEQYVVKHWGKISPDRALLQPGLRIKWPWPIDTAQRFQTGIIHEIILGVGDHIEHELTKDGSELILWTKEHGFGSQSERNFLIGVPPREEVLEEKDTPSSKAPAVSIIKLVVIVKYRVTDPYKYGYKYIDSKELLSCIADEELVQYCASATLDQNLPGAEDRLQGIMTLGREEAAKELKKRIQKKLDNIDLGVEIVFVGIVSAHPPSEAVPQFEKVLETERLQDQQRYQAQAEANRILSDVAGNSDNALELFLALRMAEIFEELSKIKAEKGSFDKATEDFVRQTKDQVSALELEIYREKLLGKKESDMRNSMRLRDGYRNFLDQLQLAQKQRDSFDYTATIQIATRRIDALFAKLEGAPARLIAEAQADRWKKQLRAQTALETYRRMLLPFNESPRVYMFDRYMDVLDETLPGMKKYVIGVDRKLLEVRLNLEQQRSVIGEGLDSAADAN